MNIDTQKNQINETLILLILASINFTHIIDFVIIAPLNPFLKSSFGISTREFGILIASYTLSAGLSGILGFFWIDKFDRRKAVLWLYAGFMIGNVLCVFASSYWLLVAARVIAGFFGGVLGALIMSIIGDVIPQERRGKAMGIVMSAFSAASVIGIPSGLILAQKYGWNAPFLLLSILSAVVFLLIYVKMPSITFHLTASKTEAPIEMIKNIISDINVRKALLYSVFVMLSGFTVVPYVSDYMVFNVGLPKENLQYIYLFGGIATVVTGPIVGKLSDKFGKQIMFTIMASISILPILLITHLQSGISNMAIFSITTLFFVFFGGRFIPAMAISTSAVQPQHRGKFMSINSSVQQLSNALATTIAGVVIQNSASGQLIGYNLVGYISAIATITTIFLAYRIKIIS